MNFEVLIPKGLSNEAIKSITRRVAINVIIVDSSGSMAADGESGEPKIVEIKKQIKKLFIKIMEDEKFKSKIGATALNTTFIIVRFSTINDLAKQVVMQPTTYSFLSQKHRESSF